VRVLTEPRASGGHWPFVTGLAVPKEEAYTRGCLRRPHAAPFTSLRTITSEQFSSSSVRKFDSFQKVSLGTSVNKGKKRTTSRPSDTLPLSFYANWVR
jgi:hypothetical protein